MEFRFSAPFLERARQTRVSVARAITRARKTPAPLILCQNTMFQATCRKHHGKHDVCSSDNNRESGRSRQRVDEIETFQIGFSPVMSQSAVSGYLTPTGREQDNTKEVQDQQIMSWRVAESWAGWGTLTTWQILAVTRSAQSPLI
jgi:hypothetical protein